jgi:hypothetical protein
LGRRFVWGLAVNSIAPLGLGDLKPIGGEPRIHDLRLADRLDYKRPTDIRELIERNRVELERYGNLPYHTVNSGSRGRPGNEFWLNEAQALLICVKSDTPVAADVREEVIRVFLAWRHGGVPSIDTALITNSILQPMLRGFAEMTEKQDQILGLLAGQRQRIDSHVKTQHIWTCHQLGGRCPNCGKNSVTNPDGTQAPFSEFDHARHRSAPTVDDTWLICTECHKELTNGRILRKDCETAFNLYQARRKQFIAQQKPTPPAFINEIETGPSSFRFKKQTNLLTLLLEHDDKP